MQKDSSRMDKLEEGESFAWFTRVQSYKLHSCMHLFSAAFTRVFRLFQTAYNFVWLQSENKIIKTKVHVRPNDNYKTDKVHKLHGLSKSK